jgi:rhodanese-related sulfurtransferase
MPAMKRVSPDEAKKLMDEGYTYVDVRTEREFSTGHPTGSINVPLGDMTPRGLVPSPEFVPLLSRIFAKDAKIIVGCAGGVRSLKAAEMLGQAGFTDIVDQRAGFNGARGGFGAVAEKGWEASGLPVARGEDAGSLAAVKARS